MTEGPIAAKSSASHLRRRILVVAGMHRSGTSATTGALQHLNVSLGANLYRGHEGINPKGYFEHTEIADTNEEALLAIGSSWDDILLRPADWWNAPALQPFARKIGRIVLRETAHSTLWAVKDPRICRLLPWWHPILQGAGVDPMFLIVVRSPAEVFGSLQRRDGFSDIKSYLLWCLHYIEAEQASRGFPRAVLDFSRFVSAPADEMLRVERELGIEFPRSAAQARKDLATFVSADLRHHVDHQDGDATALASLARRIHGCLLAAAGDGAAFDACAMDTLRQQLVEYIDTFPPVLVEQLRTIARHRSDSQLTVNRLFRSWSYVVGKPVRLVERAFGRMV